MVRMISVGDQTYEKLARIKGGKSFSKLLDELADDRSQKILRFAGILKDSWKNRDAAKWVHELRTENRKLSEERWKRLEKHWKG